MKHVSMLQLFANFQPIGIPTDMKLYSQPQPCDWNFNYTVLMLLSFFYYQIPDLSSSFEPTALKLVSLLWCRTPYELLWKIPLHEGLPFTTV